MKAKAKGHFLCGDTGGKLFLHKTARNNAQRGIFNDLL